MPSPIMMSSVSLYGEKKDRLLSRGETGWDTRLSSSQDGVSYLVWQQNEHEIAKLQIDEVDAGGGENGEDWIRTQQNEGQ